jgi:hypothetical protein
MTYQQFLAVLTHWTKEHDVLYDESSDPYLGRKMYEYFYETKGAVGLVFRFGQNRIIEKNWNVCFQGSEYHPDSYSYFFPLELIQKNRLETIDSILNS